MERKKGYTLVELLTIIVILGILVGLATPVISKIIEYTKQKKSILLLTPLKEQHILIMLKSKKINAIL